MEKQNSQLEHAQPMEQTRGLFCATQVLFCVWSLIALLYEFNMFFVFLSFTFAGS